MGCRLWRPCQRSSLSSRASLLRDGYWPVSASHTRVGACIYNWRRLYDFISTVFTAGTRRLFLLYPGSKVEGFSARVDRVVEQLSGGNLFDCESVCLPVILSLGVDTSKCWFHSLSLKLDFMHPLALRQKHLVTHTFSNYPSSISITCVCRQSILICLCMCDVQSVE